MRATIDFFLNGERLSIPASEGRRTVLTWLREERRLTGTKEGCAEGDCGACTVVLATEEDSYLPVCSCIFVLGALDGKELISVDGLRDHPVQRAMVECHGSQCGFCTPGFVMALYAHYKNKNGSLCDALAGNLCRCTGYAPILAAGAKMFEYEEKPADEAARLRGLPKDGVADARFSAPRSVQELAAVLHPGATLLGGGTDLGLLITKQLRDLDNVVYLGNVAELKEIHEDETHLSFGGAVTYAEAHAALSAACRTLKERLARYCADAFGVKPDEVRFARNQVGIGTTKTLSFAQLARQAFLARVSLSATGYWRTPEIHFDRGSFSGEPFYYFAYGAAVSEVVVDTLTGESRLLRADLLHDIGRSVNPAIDRGQVEGGFIQGMGWLTMEELVWDAKGALATHAPSTYKIPVAGDCPPQFNVRLWERGENRRDIAYRSKAVGEPPLMLALSVFHAIHDAVGSTGDSRDAVPLEAPATPENVLKAIHELRNRSSGS